MNSADIVLVLILAGAFLFGFFQGVMRGFLNVLAWGVAFVLAANLREPIGEYLARQWTSLDSDYDHMLAFGIAAVVILVGLLIVIHVGTRGPKGTTSYPLLDDLLGGALGVLLALLIIASFLIILTSYYGPDATLGARQDAKWSSDLYGHLLGSKIGTLINDTLVPFIGLVFGILVPDVVRKAMA